MRHSVWSLTGTCLGKRFRYDLLLNPNISSEGDGPYDVGMELKLLERMVKNSSSSNVRWNLAYILICSLYLPTVRSVRPLVHGLCEAVGVCRRWEWLKKSWKLFASEYGCFTVRSDNAGWA